MKPEIKGLIPNGIELGASMMGDMENGTFTYFAGAPVNGEVPAANGMTVWELPEAEYIICSIEAETFAELATTALNKAMTYLISTWLPSRRLTIRPFSAEKYYPAASDGFSMEIWVIPVPLPD